MTEPTEYDNNFLTSSPRAFSAYWCRAMTLEERISNLLLAKAQGTAYHVDENLAKQRLHRWRSLPAFEHYSFDHRLMLVGVTEVELKQLLGEPVEAVRDRSEIAPEWLIELGKAFLREWETSTDLFSEHEYYCLLAIIFPLIMQGRDRLSQSLAVLHVGNMPLDVAGFESVLFDLLPPRILSALSRTMVLELNIARLKGLLEGETPQERFLSFIHFVSQPNAAVQILREYPVLARQLVEIVDKWVVTSSEFISRLCLDWTKISSKFNIVEREIGLRKLISAGDTHRGGRSVLIAEFLSGHKIVYKPRSMAGDVHFQELLQWVDTRSCFLKFCSIDILDCGSHGWARFVSAEDCQSVDEVNRFYERQGCYVALLYALNATDFHYQNIVAMGEHPILIDLEALFCHPIKRTDLSGSYGSAQNQLRKSVLSIGLLPTYVSSGAGSGGADLSGLAQLDKQLTPYRVPQWVNVGTDEMAVIHERITMPAGHNCPSLNGHVVNPGDYTSAIVTGFANMYRFLKQHREDLLDTNGPINNFANDEMRVILRDTHSYSSLLFDSYHPTVLSDSLNRDRLLDQLWGMVEHSERMIQVVQAERLDLSHGDIPIFTTYPNSIDLQISSGKHIANFFDETGMMRVRQKIQQLDDNDLARQLWFIQASMATLKRSGDQFLDVTKRPAKTLISNNLADPTSLIAAACTVGDRLIGTAMVSEDTVMWLSLTGDGRSLKLVGLDLYDGIPGITLFFTYLSILTQNQKYIEMASKTLATMLNLIKIDLSSLQSVGAFEGLGGLIYVLTHVGYLLQDASLISHALDIITLVPAFVENDNYLDIITGSAGCIGALLPFYNIYPSQQTMEAMVQCGNRILSEMFYVDDGRQMIQPRSAPLLASFAHGASGIAWSLFKLSTLEGQEKFRPFASAAIAYERTLFNASLGNWHDLRKTAPDSTSHKSDQTGSTVAWCHGAPGIGLSRIDMLPLIADEAVYQEIQVSLDTSVRSGFQGSHSLCHGDLGNIELLLRTSQVFNSQDWFVSTYRVAHSILEDINSHGWRCGTLYGVERPGLMVGLAGMGLQLLRLAAPANVPSVLTLEPPGPCPLN